MLSVGSLAYSIYRINQNKYNSAAVFSIGIFVLSLFYFLGVYLSSYYKVLSLFITTAGVIFSLVMMFFYFFWKEGRKRLEFIVKQDREEDITQERATLKERLNKARQTINKLQEIRKKAKEHQNEGHSKLFSYQIAYVEFERNANWKEPRNSIDFTILKEVKLNRNEYSSEDGKRRSL